MTVFITILAGYFIGAIPFGFLIARAKGVDIRQQGSGNIGATNVGRVLGWRLGILAFFLDFAKGAFPVVLARYLETATDSTRLAPNALPVLVGLAAFLGHLFPIYIRFRGGKGVATGAGVVAVLVPGPTLLALLVWLAVFCASRYVSLASMSAGVALCVVRFVTVAQPFAPDNIVLTVFCLVAAGLVIGRHYANIGRLVRGEENRVGESSAMLLITKIVHVMSIGLWFGGLMLFTFVVGLTVFRTLDGLTSKPAAERPLWLPVPPELDKERPSERFPDPLRREQGSRLAGAVVEPIFPQYFLLQTICGVLALATAYYFTSYGGGLNRIRLIIIGLALLTVLADWWLAGQVSRLRVDRNETSNVVLASPSPSVEQIEKADEARSQFSSWHLVSLLVSFLTILLVTAAMGMAASLPASPPPVSNNTEHGTE